jgi:hypothetical protein
VNGYVYEISVSHTFFGVLTNNAPAASRTETDECKQGGTVLESYLAYDDAVRGPRPGVLAAHEWGHQ